MRYALLIVSLLAALTACADIPYPAALDTAAVRESRVGDLNREALYVGNGDINALVYLTESVGIAAAIGEFLLQSVDDTIRVFPCWPKDKDAAFTNLRAQGGFLVTAEQRDGRVVKLEITSTVGGRLRVLNPWTGRLVERDTTAGETIAIPQR